MLRLAAPRGDFDPGQAQPVQYAGALGLERRLSRLAAWVLAAERGGVRYALRVPGTDIALGRGDAHRAACLQALALYKPQ